MEPDECNSAEDLTRLGWALGVYGSPSDFAREISEARREGWDARTNASRTYTAHSDLGPSVVTDYLQTFDEWEATQLRGGDDTEAK